MQDLPTDKVGTGNFGGRNFNSFVIDYPWMATHLGLRGTEALVFAIIYGFDQDGEAWSNGLISAVDVVGLNYRRHWYDRAFATYGKPIYGSATASCVSSRGVY